MNSLYKTLLSLSVPFLALSATDTAAKSTAPDFSFPRTTVSSPKSSSPFESRRMKQITAANQLLDGCKDTHSRNADKSDLQGSLGPAEIIDDIDTPWGERWYYTASYKNIYYKMSDVYSFPSMQEFEFKIYDGQLRYMGTIRDKIRYKVYEDAPMDPETQQDRIDLFGPYHRENGVAMCQVAPIITRNFFNLDDKIEIIISMSVQTTFYHNNDYNYVYQLDGETYQEADFEGNMQTYNKSISVVEAQLGDVFSTTDDDGKEKTYMTFMVDHEPDFDFDFDLGGDDDDDEENGEGTDPGDIVIPGFWENYCSYAINAEIYRGPKPGEEGIQKVKEVSFPLCKLPGDMQSTPFIISFGHDGKVWYALSHYEDTFYNPYHSPLADMSMREENNLIIELWKEDADGKGMSLNQTTKIPIYLSESTDDAKILASYFSVGDFRYRQDINFDKDGKAGFYVTKSDYLAGSDDSYLRSFYYYNADGTLGKTLFERCQSHISMSDIDGFEPQEMFIDTDYAGDYVFHFFDLNSVNESLALNYRFEIDEDSDPERMTANIDRVKRGDSYLYAAELRVPSQDENGNDIGRILWFDKKGKFDHIDNINMGKGIYYAMYYIDSSTLNPDFYHVSPQQEYMLLVKRATNNGIIEELLVAQATSEEHPEGQTLLSVQPDEKGALAKVTTDSYSETPHIFVTKSINEPGKPVIYSWDIYSLPLTGTSVDRIVKGDNDITFDGKTVSCGDAIVEIFSISGYKVAEARGNVSTDGLAAGVYVVRAAGSTARILVK